MIRIDKGSGSGATVTREDKVKQILDEIIEKLPEEFNMMEIMNKVEERTPYVSGDICVMLCDLVEATN